MNQSHTALTDTFAWHSSPLDWFENNYETTIFVVEFWNTLSSACMLFAGMAGLWFYSNLLRYEPNLWMVWLLMSIVGFGSMYFHATLSLAGQVLDELPISLLVFYSLVFLRPLKKWNPRVRGILFSPYFYFWFLIGSAIVCLTFPLLSHATTLVCIPIAVYFFSMEFRECKNPNVRRFFWYSIFFITTAFSAWLSDRFACNSLQNFFTKSIGFYPQFHALWHFLVSCCFWALLVTGMLIRLTGDSKRAHVRYDSYFGVIPYATMV